MSETTLVREIMLAVSNEGHRVFRNNTGMGWAGKSTQLPQHANTGTVTIPNARPLHAGLCVGSSDIIGWTKTGRFLAIEVKKPRRIGGKRETDEQSNFLHAVRQSGGIGLVARSPQEAIAQINEQQYQLMVKAEFPYV